MRMKRLLTLAAGVLLLSVALAATGSGASANSEPRVDDQTIRWSDPGWWQVQDADDYREICSGNIDEINSCDVGKTGWFIVINHTSGDRWNIEVTSASSGTPTTTTPEGPSSDPNTSLRTPTLRSANYFYTQAVASGNVPSGPPRGVSISWDRVHTYADGVNIYRDNVYQTTVKNNIRWQDPDGRPGSVYYIVAVRGDNYSAKSTPVTAAVDWFREHDHSDAEARIRGRLYSSHLTDFSVDQIVEAAGAAFGDRPDLISKWHRDAGGEILPYRANAGLVKCSNTYHDTRIYLPNNPGAFLTVHELAHVIDCSKSGQLNQGGETDGIGTGMYSWDKAKLVAERDRLWALNSSGNRPAWLRQYTFTDRGEFFADVSAYFLTDEWRRTRMAVEAPVLYDTLRSYYYKPQWAPASEITLVVANP